MQQNKKINLIRKASRDIVREFGVLNTRCASADISYTEGHALIEIQKHGTLTAGELAVILNLNRSSTTRTLAGLKKKGWIYEVLALHNAKKKPVALSPEGQAKLDTINRFSDHIVQRALGFMSFEDQAAAVNGIVSFAKALKLSRVVEQYTIRPIQSRDNAAIRRIIINVCKEYGTDGPGGPTADPELNDLTLAYANDTAVYLIAEDAGKLCGGAGIAPLNGIDGSVCEFQKMYLLPQHRGQGLGEILMKTCIKAAVEKGYTRMYIETVERMTQAVNLYKKLGARPITHSLGNTGHHQCESRWVIDL